MRARVEHRPDYETGHPYVVLVMRDSWGWYIDSWHKTKRQAQAVARDINNTEGNN